MLVLVRNDLLEKTAEGFSRLIAPEARSYLSGQAAKNLAAFGNLKPSASLGEKLRQAVMKKGVKPPGKPNLTLQWIEARGSVEEIEKVAGCGGGKKWVLKKKAAFKFPKTLRRPIALKDPGGNLPIGKKW